MHGHPICSLKKQLLPRLVSVTDICAGLYCAVGGFRQMSNVILYGRVFIHVASGQPDGQKCQ